MLTGYTSLLSVLHAAGSFQCSLLARSCRLPTCSYSSQRLLAGYQHVHAACQRVLAGSLQAINTFMQAATCSCRFTTPSCRLSTRSCRLSTCSCALHSHCTNSRSPKMSSIRLVHNLLESLIGERERANLVVQLARFYIIYPALMYAVMFYVILNKRKRLGDCVTFFSRETLCST